MVNIWLRRHWITGALVHTSLYILWLELTMNGLSVAIALKQPLIQSIPKAPYPSLL